MRLGCGSKCVKNASILYKNPLSVNIVICEENTIDLNHSNNMVGEIES